MLLLRTKEKSVPKRLFCVTVLLHTTIWKADWNRDKKDWVSWNDDARSRNEKEKLTKGLYEICVIVNGKTANHKWIYAMDGGDDCINTMEMRKGSKNNCFPTYVFFCFSVDGFRFYCFFCYFWYATTTTFFMGVFSGTLQFI